MRISKIILDNFRGYKHAEIDFDRFNCIVGKNDVGKSTIFEAIKWFFDKSQNDADSNFNINMLEHDRDVNEKYDEDGNISFYKEEYTSAIIGGNAMSVEIRFSEVNDFRDHIDIICTSKEMLRESNYWKIIMETDDFLNDSKELCIKKEIQHSKTVDYSRSMDFDAKPIYSIYTKQYQSQLPISLWNSYMLQKKYSIICGNNGILVSLRSALHSDDLLNKLLVPPLQERRYDTSEPLYKTIIAQIRDFYKKDNKYTLEWLPFSRYQTDFLAIVPKFRYFNAKSFETEYDSIIQDYVNSLLLHQSAFEDIQNIVSEEFKEIINVFNKTIKSNSSLTFLPKVMPNFKVQFEFTNGVDSINIKNRGEGIQNVLMNIFFRYISNKDTGAESIFVFEEPEAHLHPEAQKDFFHSLRKLSERYKRFGILPFIHTEATFDKLKLGLNKLIIFCIFI